MRWKGKERWGSGRERLEGVGGGKEEGGGGPGSGSQRSRLIRVAYPSRLSESPVRDTSSTRVCEPFIRIDPRLSSAPSVSDRDRRSRRRIRHASPFRARSAACAADWRRPPPSRLPASAAAPRCRRHQCAVRMIGTAAIQDKRGPLLRPLCVVASGQDDPRLCRVGAKSCWSARSLRTSAYK